MPSFISNIAKTVTALPQAADSTKQKGVIMDIAAKDAEKKKLQDELKEKIAAGEYEKTMETGNIFQRFGAGFKQGKDVSKEALDESLKTTTKKPSLKETLLNIFVPGSAAFNQGNMALVNRAVLPFSRGTTAAQQPGLEKIASLAWQGSAPGMLYGNLSEKNQDKIKGSLATVVQKASDEYGKLPEKDRKKLANFGRFLESVSFISSLPGAASLGKASIKSTLAGASKLPGIKTVASSLEGASESQLGKIFNPTTKYNKMKTGQIVGDVAKGEKELPFAVTRKGLASKLEEKTGFFGKAIETFEDSGKVTGTSKTSKFLKYIEGEKGKYMEGDVVLDESAIKSLDDLGATISKFGEDIPGQKLLSIKRKFDAIIKKKGGYSKLVAPDTDLDIKKDFTDVIRTELAKNNPDLDALNKQFTFYKNAEKILAETLERKTGQTGLMDKLAVVPGAIIGGATMSVTPAALGAATTWALYKTFTSTGWRQVSAALKTNLAKLLVSGDKVAIKDILKQINKDLVTKGFVAASLPQIPEFMQKAADSTVTGK